MCIQRLRPISRPSGSSKRLMEVMPRVGLTWVASALIPISFAQAQTTKPQIAITSAAGYQQAVAPNSLATLFGQGLSGTTRSAKLGPNGQLPTQLAGISVEVNAELAEL